MPPGNFQLDLERSLGIFVFLVITHTTAGLSLIPLAFPPELKVVLGFTVVLSFCRYCAIYGWFPSHRSIVGVTVYPQGKVVLFFRNGKLWQGQMRSDSYMHPMVVLLRAGTIHDIRSIVLLRSQVGDEQYHHLTGLFLTCMRNKSVDGV